MNRKGFTLLELIVVLIVLAVLVAIALPQYLSFVERGRSAEAIAAIGAIKTAEESNRLSTGAYLAAAWPPNPSAGITLAVVNWTYACTGAGVITATRQNTLGAGANANTTIIMNLNNGNPNWGAGNHPGQPR